MSKLVEIVPGYHVRADVVQNISVDRSPCSLSEIKDPWDVMCKISDPDRSVYISSHKTVEEARGAAASLAHKVNEAM